MMFSFTPAVCAANWREPYRYEALLSRIHDYIVPRDYRDSSLCSEFQGAHGE